MRTISFIALAIIYSLNSFAQSHSQMSDDVKDFSTANIKESGVNLYSGKPNISVPLEEIAESSFNMPITLSYDAGGIKVMQSPSNVGLGWSLNIGGSITRIVNGKADESNFINYPEGAGYLYNQTYCNANPGGAQCFNDQSVWAAIPNYFTRSATVGAYAWTIWDFRTLRDPAPDKFIFQVGVSKFSFSFNQDGTIASESKAKVEYVLGRRTSASLRFDLISSWIITTEDGIKYHFSQAETTTIQEGYTRGLHPLTTDKIILVNKWHLTTIQFPDGRNSIDFEYVLENNPEPKYFSDDTAAEYFDGNGNNVHIMFSPCGYGDFQYSTAYIDDYNLPNPKQYLLSKIKSRSKTIILTYDMSLIRGGSKHVKPLAKIEIIGGNGYVIREISFNYTSLFDNGYQSEHQFLLSSFNLKLGQTNYGNYSFNYTSNSPIEAYPPYGSGFNGTTGIDHWGYYSGPVAAYFTLIPDWTTVCGVSCISSRAPNPTYANALSLTKMTYPSGGWTEYEFEPNDYSYVANTLTSNTILAASGLRIKSIRNHDVFSNSNTADVVRRYEYKSLSNALLSSGVIESEPTYLFDYHPNTASFPPFTLRLRRSSSIGPIGIGYRSVTELNGDGSKTVYVYTTAKQYPHEEFQTTGNGSYVVNEDFNETQGLEKYIRYNHPFVHNEGRYDYMRGLLVEKHDYDSQGTEVRSVVNTYVPKEVSRIPAFSQFSVSMHAAVQSSVGYLPTDVCFLKVYDVPVGFPQLQQSITKSFDPGNAAKFRQQTTTYSYNPTNYAVAARTTYDAGSDEAEEEEFLYSCDYTAANMNGAIGIMQSNNILNNIVSYRKFRFNPHIGQFGSYVSVAGYLQEYEAHGLPTKTYRLNHSTSPSLVYYNLTNYFAYGQDYSLDAEKKYQPSTNHVASEKSKGGPFTTALWSSYPSAGPVAVASGPEFVQSQTASVNIANFDVVISASSPLGVFTLAEPKLVTFNVTLTKQNTSPQDMAFLLQFTSSTNPLVRDSKMYYVNNVVTNAQFSTSLPPGNYNVSAEYKLTFTGSAPISPVRVQIGIDASSIKQNIYQESFEDDANAITGPSKTGNRSWNGVFTVPVPTQTGDYILSYWERPASGGNWVFHQQSVAVSTSTILTIGSGTTSIDEVRLYPVGTQVVSSTYDPVLGKTSEMNANGLTTTYEYDPLGRMKVIKDDKGNIVKTFEYHNQ